MIQITQDKQCYNYFFSLKKKTSFYMKMGKQGLFIVMIKVANSYLTKLPFTKYEGLNKSILSSWPSIWQIFVNK